MSIEEVEGVAADLRDRVGFGAIVDPWELAGHLGVGVEWGPRGCRSSIRCEGGRHVAQLDPAEPERRQASHLTHEIGHPVLERYGLPSDDAHAWRFAAAMLKPRDDLELDLRRGLWLHEIAASNPFTSHELVARRLVGLRSTYVLRVVDVEPKANEYTVRSLGWRWPRAHTPPEAEAIAIVLETREPFEGNGVRAWSVEERGYVRVLCVADGESIGDPDFCH